MKKFAMTVQSKQEVENLGILASKAYSALLYAESPRFKGKPEDRKVIEQKSKETAENLQRVVKPLSPEAVKELADWLQRRAVNAPVTPRPDGTIVWDGKKGSELAGGFLSVMSALSTVHGEKGKDMLRHPKNMAGSAMAWNKTCIMTGYAPRDGMVYEEREVLIRKLNELMVKTKNEGKDKEALKLYDYIAGFKGKTGFLKPKEVVELPKGVTLDADTTNGPENLGQVTGASTTPAAEAVAKPAVPAETAKPQTEAEKLADKAFGDGKKPKGEGKPPFVSARPGKKQK